jgi:prepilin-type N-terminal cleavage/methylation domain-containing protein
MSTWCKPTSQRTEDNEMPLIQNTTTNRAVRAISRRATRRATRGFTLIEMLVVVGVMVLLMTLSIPAFNAMRGTGDFSAAVYDISGLMEQARSYAMANNTYVLAGVMECSASVASTTSPQQIGTGRVAIALIASKTGTRPYQSLLNQALSSGAISGWANIYGSGTGAFIAITKPATFPNVHIVNLQAQGVPNTGAMVRPAVNATYNLAVAQSCYSSTPFAWPLGTQLNSTAQYLFNQVIEFSPEGSARIIGSNLDAIPYCIEIGLQPSHGGEAAQPASTTSGQIAAIQIDGMTGSTHIYRP